MRGSVWFFPPPTKVGVVGCVQRCLYWVYWDMTPPKFKKNMKLLGNVTQPVERSVWRNTRKFYKSPDLTENTPGTKTEFDMAYKTASY